MPQLLVSVRNAAEARVVLPFGPDILDLKEPRRGSLGRAATCDIIDLCQNVPATQTCSIAMGELVDLPSDVHRTDLQPIERFRFAKIGLAGTVHLSDWQSRFRRWSSLLPDDSGSVTVAYLDFQKAAAPDVEYATQFAADNRCGAVLFDTFAKNDGGFDRVIDAERLKFAIQRTRQLGMMSVLAGSVTIENLPMAVDLNPDVIGVRGAICADSRSGSASVDRCREFFQKFYGLSATHGKKLDSTFKL